jgi:hypothetical protein
MKRVYFSPKTDSIPMNPAAILCASSQTNTPFGVENTAIDNQIIS